MEHAHRRATDINFEPYEVCNLKFITRANGLACAWTLGTVAVAATVAAISWANVTSNKIAVLETKQEQQQAQIMSKLDFIASKIDNTRTGSN